MRSIREGLCYIAAGALLWGCASAADAASPARSGYYRFPAVHDDTIVFTSEGDLWSVGAQGGTARRLTSNAGNESLARISPDGSTIAFRAQYEGPSEVYTMPLAGGVPRRRTWSGDAVPAAWTPAGELLVSTARYASLPEPQLLLLDAQGNSQRLPLSEGYEAAYSIDGRTLYFTRWRKQGSYTRRYRGGSAEAIWAFDGSHEAVSLTHDWPGTSHAPMVWQGRIYFLSDRDGVMNVWSMDPQGGAPRQESHQRVFDIASASLSQGRIVYACAADLWSLDLASGREAVVPITLASDFEQLRDHWVKKPVSYLSDVHIAPDGSSIAVSARGAIFTLPAKSGRIVQVAHVAGARYRNARFTPDGKMLIVLSTETGEAEFWRYAANGSGARAQLTHGATVLRWDGLPSPDGHYFAHRDKDQQLWLFDLQQRTDTRIAVSSNDDITDLSWSPDSRWLAYAQTADNSFAQLFVYGIAAQDVHALTSNRYNSSNPVWSSDGKWLYFLSDRALDSTVESPWGPREPEPHFAKPMKIYQLALMAAARSPFEPADELHPDAPAKVADATAAAPADRGRKKPGQNAPAIPAAKVPSVSIEFAGLAERLQEVPAAPGNYDKLQATEKRLCWLDATDSVPVKNALQCLDIANKGDEAETVFADLKNFEISLDRKKMLIVRDEDFYIVDSDVKAAVTADPKALGKAQVNLSRWSFATDPRAEYRGIFLDAWRLERDYFYDRKMVGVDWNAAKARYLPLIERVSDREELNDVIAQMVSELSTLHTFVFGGDVRKSADQIDLGSLGARLRRDAAGGGYRVEHVYRHDPDLPDRAAPLARPQSLVRDGEIITAIDGIPLVDVADERALLRGKVDTQVLLRVRGPGGAERDVIVKPIKASDETNLRYGEWEYTRRQAVEAEGRGQIGYVHLRAMGPKDIEQWARDYYPVFDRAGLIIDVRHNRGGNIDSWLLARLLRQAWAYWQPRVGAPHWNMQYAFRGHLVVLCDQNTSSDGEAFAEGFKRFKLGRLIGTRTWGGEVWLSADNFELDGGIATAGETGLYGPEGRWLIEGHGVDPDITVDNLPHATAAGEDAQLAAAIRLLREDIARDPRKVPASPPYPDNHFDYPH